MSKGSRAFRGRRGVVRVGRGSKKDDGNKVVLRI